MIMCGGDVIKSQIQIQRSKCFYLAQTCTFKSMLFFVLESKFKTRLSYPDNNITLFQSIFPPRNKKYNSVSSSISQNMMNEQSRNIYIFCRIFLMNWILPESSHSSCVHSYYSWAEVAAVTFLLTVIWHVFLLTFIKNKKTHRAKHTLDFSWV